MRLLLRLSIFLFSLSIFYSCKDKVEPIEPKIIEKDIKLNFNTKNDEIVVDGYLNKFSYGQSETATLYINAKTKNDTIVLGIYDMNNKLVDAVRCAVYPQKMSANAPYLNGYDYKASGKYVVSKTLKSGMYFLAKKIPFIVKNTSSKKGDFLIVHPSHNDLAYNNGGGYSYYFPTHSERARVVSFDRPWTFGENGDPRPFYKWILQKGYNADFICDDEMQDYKNIESYKMMLLAGHSEYWTRPARENFDKFVDAGKNALLLTGNTMYWQTRVDTVKKQLICYKYDAYYNDPTTNILLKTSRWEDSWLKYDQLYSIGLNFYTYGGYITARAKDPKGFEGFKIIQPDFPIFKGMNLKMNDVIKHNSIEYDGANVNFVNDATYGAIPVYDNSLTKFYKVSILGWDFARPDYGVINNHYSIGLCIALKRKSTSGVIINMSSSNWCTEISQKTQLQQISANAIDFLLKNNDFTVKSIQ